MTNIPRGVENLEDLKKFINNDNLSDNNFKEKDFENLNDKARQSNPIFKAFGYPSKIYYPSIQKFIKAYTKKDAVVLDSFCGSGTTGIAALLENRKAILIDNSPNAIHLTKNTFSTPDLGEVEQVYSKLKEDLTDLINGIYKTKTSDGKDGYAESIITTNTYTCPECNELIKLHNTATKKRSEYNCLNCGFILNIGKASHKSRLVDRRIPVEVNIRIIEPGKGRKTEKRAVTGDDIKEWDKIIQAYNSEYGHLWSPTEQIIYNRCYPRVGGWPGFPIDSTVSDLFSERNLIALKILYNYINTKIKNHQVKDFLMFVFTDSLFRNSKRLFTTSGIKTVYHIPPVGKEQNVLTVFNRKFKTILKAKNYVYDSIDKNLLANNVKVIKHTASNLPLDDNTIDFAFIDPPYGGVVPYAELNLFYSAWLGEKEDLENEVIIPMDYEKKIEFVKQWGSMLEAAFQEVYRVLKPGAYFTIVFQSKFNEIWNELRDLMSNRIGFQFENIIANERATTFHTNSLNDTNPESAFITYRKPLENQTLQMYFKELNKNVFDNDFLDYFETKRTFREIQSHIIGIVHKHDLDSVPSDKEIKDWLNTFCKVEENFYTKK